MVMVRSVEKQYLSFREKIEMIKKEFNPLGNYRLRGCYRVQKVGYQKTVGFELKAVMSQSIDQGLRASTWGILPMLNR